MNEIQIENKYLIDNILYDNCNKSWNEYAEIFGCGKQKRDVKAKVDFFNIDLLPRYGGATLSSRDRMTAQDKLNFYLDQVFIHARENGKGSRKDKNLIGMSFLLMNCGFNDTFESGTWDDKRKILINQLGEKLVPSERTLRNWVDELKRYNLMITSTDYFKKIFNDEGYCFIPINIYDPKEQNNFKQFTDFIKQGGYYNDALLKYGYAYYKLPTYILNSIYNQRVLLVLESAYVVAVEKGVQEPWMQNYMIFDVNQA